MDGLSQDSELNPRRRQPVGHGVQFVRLLSVCSGILFLFWTKIKFEICDI